ncbi:MAG TPA: hypothetical protein VKZ59_14960 [Acidobacteriota bacterium]|nr:hypothetical protein [Acidobacteriota bacterium]
MELLVESGLTPMQVIQGATSLNARFFRMSDRLVRSIVERLLI